MQELDSRIVIIGVEVDGQLKKYEGLYLSAYGTKYANPNQDECEIKITNLTKEAQDYILTETSPFNQNQTPKTATIEAGRKSYGTARIFLGDIASSVPTQPPDVAVTLKCLTKNYDKGKIVSRNQPGKAPLSKIARQVASDLNVTLDFQAKDRDISNYTYTGGALKQVDRLQEAGYVDTYIDGDVLVVKDMNIPLPNKLRVLDVDTGMIGIPEITEQGIKVKFLLDNETAIGGGLRIRSNIYPSINGDYVIYKLNFEITSRDVPFYWIAEAKRL